MSHSIIPERSIQFSPSLAAAIGVDAAIVLQHLQLLSEVQAIDVSAETQDANYVNAIEVSYQSLVQQLPFWTPEILRRILHRLIELGMIKLSAQVDRLDASFYCTINPSSAVEQSESRHSVAGESTTAQVVARSDSTDSRGFSGASKITSSWRPSADALALLAQNGVPAEFAKANIDEFVLYWRERNEASHAWSSKFVQHISRQWQIQQNEAHRSASLQQNAAQNNSTARPMQRQWQPNADAVEILERMGIHRNFIADAVPEFVLYWQERNESQSTWNSKFVAHTKKQWARFTNTLKHDTEPKLIASDWQPNPEVYEVLTLANIEHDFARELVAEFVLYWRDRAELHHSWNTKFLQFVKLQWSRQRQSEKPDLNPQSKYYENNRSTNRPRKTRDIPLAEMLTDRSWAN